MSLVLNGTGIVSSNIVDGTIVNADINASAAIAGSKLTGAGKVLQVVSYATGAVATSTSTITGGDNIPTITQGLEVMTLNITPTSTTNKLMIEVTSHSTCSSTTNMVTALFVGTTTNALASTTHYRTANHARPDSVTHHMVAGTTSALTFRVRMGGHNGGTHTFNGEYGNRLYGGTLASTITITEYEV